MAAKAYNLALRHGLIVVTALAAGFQTRRDGGSVILNATMRKTSEKKSRPFPFPVTRRALLARFVRLPLQPKRKPVIAPALDFAVAYVPGQSALKRRRPSP